MDKVFRVQLERFLEHYPRELQVTVTSKVNNMLSDLGQTKLSMETVALLIAMEKEINE